MRRIVIDCLSSVKRTALCENGELIEFIAEDKNGGIAVGDIYVGRVQKILPSKFAFIDLGFEKNAFLQLTDKKQECLYTINERTGKSELKIKQGDSIVVQIEKEGSDLKAPAVVVNLSFSGKFLVLIANQKGIGISKKIFDTEKRKELTKIAEEILPENFAVIMRTNCENAAKEDIISEINLLLEKYKDVIKKGEYTKAPAILYKAENETEKIIRDFALNDDDEIVINDDNEFKAILEKHNNVKLYDSAVPIFDYFGIQSQLEKALHNKIWLKSGGFLIFDEIEACTVIDVNSGKFIGKDRRKTYLKTNLEAVAEISKQIRLRNISGMIIIDFIDMVEQEDKIQVENAIRMAVKSDRINVTIVGMTELGLMQLTRKKTRKSLSKVLTRSCPYCAGTGRVENEFYIADRIRERVCSIFAGTIYDTVTVSASKRVIDAFKGKDNEYKLIEEKYQKMIKINVISTQKLDYFEIEKEKLN